MRKETKTAIIGGALDMLAIAIYTFFVSMASVGIVLDQDGVEIAVLSALFMSGLKASHYLVKLRNLEGEVRT